MNYEQKYKEALGWMRSLYDGLHGPTKEEAEHYFPELVEKDEKIKNEIIAFVEQSIHRGGGTPISQEQENKWLTWIEKQGEQTKEWSEEDEYLLKETIEHLEELIRIDKKHFSGHDVPYYQRDIDWLKSLKFKKQGNQLVDKVKPKFKVGDWLQYRYAEPFLVEEITEQGYCNGNSCLPFEWEDEIHLWTIQDAKDGDVLAVEPINSYSLPFVAIYKERGLDFFNSYYCISFDGNFYKSESGHSTENIHPATKEQRDLLFQKMKEAGYEWRQEEKKLIKINEPKFNVDDWVILNGTIAQILDKQEYGFAGLDVDGKDFFCNYGHTDSMHLWTIQDAKDGDILCYETDELKWILIFKDIVPVSSLVPHDSLRYHALLSNNEVYGSDIIAMVSDDIDYYCRPATKEERDLLFQKMREVNTEWDAEKKELRKIDTYQLRENPCSGCTNTKGCITCVNGDQKSTSTPRILYSDDVIGWLRQHTCTACFDKPDEAISQRINKFKEDFDL